MRSELECNYTGHRWTVRVCPEHIGAVMQPECAVCGHLGERVEVVLADGGLPAKPQEPSESVERFVSGPCAICCGNARYSDGRWCEACGRSGTVHMIVPTDDAQEAVSGPGVSRAGREGFAIAALKQIANAGKHPDAFTVESLARKARQGLRVLADQAVIYPGVSRTAAPGGPVATLEAIVSAFCKAVGEPIPQDAIYAAQRHREALVQIKRVAAIEAPPVSDEVPAKVWKLAFDALGGRGDQCLGGGP